MGELSELTPDEFDKWLTPLQAVQACNGIGSAHRIVDAINQRVRSGLIRFAAETFESSRAPGRSLARYIMAPEIWQWAEPGAQDYFWSTSDIKFTAYPHSRDARNIRLFGVRFDPVGIGSLLRATGIHALGAAGPESTADALPVPETAKPRKTRHGMPALKDELLAEWFALFRKAYPNGSKEMAEDSARGAFPNHSVDRQKVRDLYGAAAMGRPRINKEK